MRPEVAIVAGGSMHVWDEIELAKRLCLEAGKSHVIFACNDMMEAYPHPCIGVTLHPSKIATWTRARAGRGFPAMVEIWNHHQHVGVTNHVSDWGGSVGLFAPKVAIARGHRKVLLCGVPMVQTIRHFKRDKLWNDCRHFIKKWDRRIPELIKFTRSFSGWTAGRLGVPSVEFLREGEQT